MGIYYNPPSPFVGGRQPLDPRKGLTPPSVDNPPRYRQDSLLAQINSEWQQPWSQYFLFKLPQQRVSVDNPPRYSTANQGAVLEAWIPPAAPPYQGLRSVVWLPVSANFTGTPLPGSLLKTGRNPTLTITRFVNLTIDYEFYYLVPFRKWLELVPARTWVDPVAPRTWSIVYGDVVMAIGPKDPTEVVVATIDFSQELGTETITAIISFVATTQRGIDSNPSAILSGVASISGGTKVQQAIQGGISGVAYGLKATVSTSGGRIIVGDTLLPVGTE